VFPGIADGRAVDVVFAVYMKPRRPTIRAAIVDAVTDQELASLTIPFQRSAPPSSAPLYDSIKESQY
jgi:predicted SnoaL-like aldol condensation-catalyzing enzyme